MKRKHVLFVCEGNVHRSRTAESMYAHSQVLKVKSAGIVPSARVQITEELLIWADIVIAMEPSILNRLRRRWADELEAKPIICLNVPDEYQYLDVELQDVLIEQLTPHLGRPDDGTDSDL